MVIEHDILEIAANTFIARVKIRKNGEAPYRLKAYKVSLLISRFDTEGAVAVCKCSYSADSKLFVGRIPPELTMPFIGNYVYQIIVETPTGLQVKKWLGYMHAIPYISEPYYPGTLTFKIENNGQHPPPAPHIRLAIKTASLEYKTKYGKYEDEEVFKTFTTKIKVVDNSSHAPIIEVTNPATPFDIGLFINYILYDYGAIYKRSVTVFKKDAITSELTEVGAVEWYNEYAVNHDGSDKYNGSENGYPKFGEGSANQTGYEPTYIARIDWDGKDLSITQIAELINDIEI